jgi:hypothetical protein
VLKIALVPPAAPQQQDEVPPAGLDAVQDGMTH